MFQRWTAAPSDAPESVITRTSTVTGAIRTDGDIRIYGTLEGELETTGTVTVGLAAHLTAQITARDVTVMGTVVGNIRALGRVEILAGGRVLGDVAAAALRIEDGAVFSGRSVVLGQDMEALLSGPFGNPILELPEG